MSEANRTTTEYIRYVMERTGQKPSALAMTAGLAASTLTRALNSPDYKFALSTTTLNRIAEATGITMSDYLGSLSKTGPSEASRAVGKVVAAAIRATVEAGAWREVDELDQSDPIWISVPRDDKFPDATQDVFEVSGDSMNALQPHPITPGSRIVGVRYDEVASRAPLRDGLIVVVQRTRDGGHTREMSVKQVAWFEDRIEFQPRSTNPKHKPIIVRHDDWEDDGVVVEIISLVRSVIHQLPT